MPFDLASMGIEKLSVTERLNLIDQIWDSLPESVDPADVPGWHLVELAKRRADLQTIRDEVEPSLERSLRGESKIFDVESIKQRVTKELADKGLTD